MAKMPSTLSAKKALYEEATTAYYNGNLLVLSDAQFNKLEDAIKKEDPEWDRLKKTGVRVADKKTEGPLDRYMPSLDKMYEEGVPKFYKRKSVAGVSHWILMDKLDGTSLQLTYKKRKPVKLMTRGDGTNGGDISFMIPALVKNKLIPAAIPSDETFVFRLEGLMKISIFNKKYSREAKGKDGWDNIRNGVNGLFNKKVPGPAIKYVDLVVLGVYGVPIRHGLETASEFGFDVVRHSLIKDGPDSNVLTMLLNGRRGSSQYEMDGLVLCPADFIMDYTSADRPKAMIAFKSNDEDGADEVVVENIIWQKSRLKRWIPKIKIVPTPMDGVMVKHAAAHNAKWMKTRGIGPGAKVKVLRSGRVIPKIVGVVSKAKFKEPPGPYVVKGVHFIMKSHDKTTVVRGIHFFMTTLGIEFLAGKTIEKLYDAHSDFTSIEGYLYRVDEARVDYDTVHTVLVECGLGKIQAGKILDELGRVLNKRIRLLDLMVASGAFEVGGMGRKKLAQLEAAGLSMAKLCGMQRTTILMTIPKIHGFSDKTATLLADGIEAFNAWYNPLNIYLDVDGSLPKKRAVVSGPLSGVKVAWTSFRSAEQEALVVKLGGEVVKYGAAMTVLLYKPGAKFMDKINAAGSKAMTWDKFASKYGIR